MNPEDEMRDLLGRARTDSESSEHEWEAFLSRAHRSVAIRRGLLAAGAVVVLAVGIAAGAALTDRAVREPEPFSPAGSPEATATPESSPPEEAEVVQPNYDNPGPQTDPGSVVQVWFLAGEEGDPQLAQTYRDVGDTAGIGRAAIEALLAGPNPDESRLATYVPEGTTLLDLTIERGTAIVDLSAQFMDTQLGSGFEQLPLTQVVWTLTQFDTVERVVFEIEGDRIETYGSHGSAIDGPQTRADHEDWASPIVVDTPFPGQQVGTTFEFEGSANVFEANVSYEVVDADGEVLDSGFTTATCGTGCRGDYSSKVRVEVSTPTDAVLRVYEASAEDGSPLHTVRVRITIVP